MPKTFLYRALASQTIHSVMARLRKRLIAAALAFALGLGVASASLAAEPQPTATQTASEREAGVSESSNTSSREVDEGTEAEVKTEQNKPASKARHTPTKRTRSDRDEDVFRPSEDISEDFAVSFPVDI